MSIRENLLSLSEHSHCILTSSGSAAIITALISAGIPKGSEVLIPSLCCPAVLFAVQIAGFKYKLIDVNKSNFNIDTFSLKKNISANTKAVIAVHMYGIPCSLIDLSYICKKNNLILIEDSCLILKNKDKFSILSELADFSIISFGYDKPISINYGGAVFTSNESFFQRASIYLKENKFFSFALKKTNEQLLIRKLELLDESNKLRIRNVSFIESLISKSYLTSHQSFENIPLWRYPILIENLDRNILMEKAKEINLIITSHYQSLSRLTYSQDCYNAEFISDRIINIFVRSDTSVKDIRAKVNLINSMLHE